MCVLAAQRDVQGRASAELDRIVIRDFLLYIIVIPLVTVDSSNTLLRDSAVFSLIART